MTKADGKKGRPSLDLGDLVRRSVRMKKGAWYRVLKFNGQASGAHLAKEVHP